MRIQAGEFGEAASIGQTINIDGVDYPFRPVALLSYRDLQAHTNGTLAIMAQETIMMLVGALGVPGSPLPRSMDARRFDGEPQLLSVDTDGMVASNTMGWHLFTPFSDPPKSLELKEYGPLALDMGHLVPMTMADPQKFGFDYVPEVMVMYHANPFTNAGNRTLVEEGLRKLDLVVSINIYLDEATDFADVVLPEHSYLECYNLINFSHDTRGLQISQPVVKPLHDTMDGMDILIELAHRADFLFGEDGFNTALNRLLELEDPYRLDLGRKYKFEEILDMQVRTHSHGEKTPDWYKRHGNDLKRNLDKHGIEERLGVRINTDIYRGIPYWEASPVHERDADYDFFLISYKSYMTTYADTATNPIMHDL
ncbi:MAG: hypothetical protein CL569_12870 [Alphaproteobacteria bacterium]|nr:hypothetical protein [Alphaproteobacteria bacterium]